MPPTHAGMPLRLGAVAQHGGRGHPGTRTGERPTCRATQRGVCLGDVQPGLPGLLQRAWLGTLVVVPWPGAPSWSIAGTPRGGTRVRHAYAPLRRRWAPKASALAW